MAVPARPSWRLNGRACGTGRSPRSASATASRPSPAPSPRISSSKRVRQEQRLPYRNPCAAALFAGILHVRDPVELDIDDLAADILDTADIDRLDDVARLGIDLDGAARAVDLHAFERRHRLVAVGGTLKLLDGLIDRRHAVIAADRQEIRAEIAI